MKLEVSGHSNTTVFFYLEEDFCFLIYTLQIKSSVKFESW